MLDLYKGVYTVYEEFYFKQQCGENLIIFLKMDNNNEVAPWKSCQGILKRAFIMPPDLREE